MNLAVQQKRTETVKSSSSLYAIYAAGNLNFIIFHRIFILRPTPLPQQASKIIITDPPNCSNHINPSFQASHLIFWVFGRHD